MGYEEELKSERRELNRLIRQLKKDQPSYDELVRAAEERLRPEYEELVRFAREREHTWLDGGFVSLPPRRDEMSDAEIVEFMTGAAAAEAFRAEREGLAPLEARLSEVNRGLREIKKHGEAYYAWGRELDERERSLRER
jgi:hypothetical protein